MISATRKIRFVRRPNKSRAIAAASEAPGAQPTDRVPRISRLMALAIHFDRLIREGVVQDHSELARLVHVTQPRMTQIMNLNLLSPDIQEELLLLPVTRCCAPFEKSLRPICVKVDWEEQRRTWQQLRAAADGSRRAGAC